MTDATRHATGMIVNALTLAMGEATDDWLLCNALHARLWDGLSFTLLTECGAPFASRLDRFNGVTFCVWDIQLHVCTVLHSPHRRL
jgi:hypothetical protein